ncbi:MAG: hypothetical protein K2H64_10220 [Desulfovibrio sp.]|nr:hypothetical protein [Desulfovibrio sp.]
MPVKTPPLEKIAEAWTALASDRVLLHDPADAPAGAAEVVSSNGAKTYRLTWVGNVYASDDSATIWQKYPGYPVLALLMARGELPYDPELAACFRNVDWNAANAKAKRNYAEAFKNVCAELKLSPEIIEKAKSESEKTLEKLKTLDISLRPYRKKKA